MKAALFLLLGLVLVSQAREYLRYDFNDAHVNPFYDQDWIDRTDINKRVHMIPANSHITMEKGVYLTNNSYISVPINEYGDLEEWGMFVKYQFNPYVDSEHARFVTDNSYVTVRCIENEYDLVAHFSCPTTDKEIDDHEATYTSDCKCSKDWAAIYLYVNSTGDATNITFYSYDSINGLCKDYMHPRRQCHIKHKGNSKLEVLSTGTYGVVNHLALRDDLFNSSKFIMEARMLLNPPFDFSAWDASVYKNFDFTALHNGEHIYSQDQLGNAFTMTGWFNLGGWQASGSGYGVDSRAELQMINAGYAMDDDYMFEEDSIKIRSGKKESKLGKVGQDDFELSDLDDFDYEEMETKTYTETEIGPNGEVITVTRTEMESGDMMEKLSQRARAQEAEAEGAAFRKGAAGAAAKRAKLAKRLTKKVKISKEGFEEGEEVRLGRDFHAKANTDLEGEGDGRIGRGETIKGPTLGDGELPFDGNLFGVDHKGKNKISFFQKERFGGGDLSYFTFTGRPQKFDFKHDENTKNRWLYAAMTVFEQEEDDDRQMFNSYFLINDNEYSKEGMEFTLPTRDLKFKWNSIYKDLRKLRLYRYGLTPNELRYKRQIECNELLMQLKTNKINDICMDCDADKYLDKTNQCMDCHPLCASCKDGTSKGCLRCALTLHPTGECVSKCPPKKFASFRGFCDNCHESCADCLTASRYTCLACAPGFPFVKLHGDGTMECNRYCDAPLFGDLERGVCVTQCPAGYYPDGNRLCRKCHPYCKGCNGPEATDCIECAAGYFRNATVRPFACFASCPRGFYGDASTGICMACHSYCMACFGPSNNECMYGCKKGIYELGLHSCVLKCPKGYWPTEDFVCLDYSKICISCHEEWRDKGDYVCETEQKAVDLSYEVCQPNCKKGWKQNPISYACEMDGEYQEHGYHSVMSREYDDADTLRVVDTGKITKISGFWNTEDYVSGLEVFYDGKTGGKHISWGDKLGKDQSKTYVFADDEYITEIIGEVNFDYITFKTNKGIEFTFGDGAGGRKFTLKKDKMLVQSLKMGIGAELSFLGARFMPQVAAGFEEAEEEKVVLPPPPEEPENERLGLEDEEEY